MKNKWLVFSLLSLSFVIAVNNNQAIADDALLPPIKQFQGKSLQLVKDKSDKWQTGFEKSNMQSTSNYQNSIKYITELANSDQQFNIVSIGKSPQNRDIWMLIASKDGAKTPEQLRNNKKPTLFIQAGIHAGEIDGKDASFMLLRDISKNNKGHLLDKVNLLFIPILNVDGHERSSPHNRVNQRGPTNMGWRTTAQNLNLNRDYAKADTPEMQALINTINLWKPALYLDIHVTDGEDYQYDITYGFNGTHGYSPNISKWLDTQLKPTINAELIKNGHLGGPLTFGIDNKDFAKGLFGWTASPRYSNGWGDARHLPTILVENHSLKPYHQRVLGTYVFLETIINKLAKSGHELITATQKDINRKSKTLALSWSADSDNPEYMDFQGMEYQQAIDELTGIQYIKWTGKAKTYNKLPIFWARKPNDVVDVPNAYYLPAQHLEVIKRLRNQGILLEVLTQPESVEVTVLTATDYSFGKTPFEGHLTADAKFSSKTLTKVLPIGTVKVSTKQKLGTLAVVLLDPRAPDSYFKWGFFNQMFQQTEYIESYAMVPLAHKMLKADPELKKEFIEKFGEAESKEVAAGISSNEKASNEKISKENASKKAASLEELFAGSSDNQSVEKMKWLYQRSVYYDNQHLKYPVLLEME
ncbi:M14 family metallopeptidase [Psychrosphaera saromensis]|uniref:Peptidase M14 domain-containing protein n=1 Tax=Psychrosphaera saromensis TaxID=716813 RepID=A0A2S7UZP9_9GAMM|nr:M14 family metallopeptidase [Psychrosphaera saromensis]PQJ54982.1 hypothetical protein BTO11_15840 [Psychrosphaera saromensis]